MARGEPPTARHQSPHSAWRATHHSHRQRTGQHDHVPRRLALTPTGHRLPLDAAHDFSPSSDSCARPYRVASTGNITKGECVLPVIVPGQQPRAVAHVRPPVVMVQESEKPRIHVVVAFHFLIVESEAGETAINGKNPGLRFDFLGRKHTADRCE